LRIDAERGDGHASVPQHPQGPADQRAGDPAAAPRPAHLDVVEPTHVESDVLVLYWVDRVHDRASNLIAVPGDLPHGGVEVGVREELDEVLLVPNRRLVVVLERLDVRLPDATMLIRG